MFTPFPGHVMFPVSVVLTLIVDPHAGTTAHAGDGANTAPTGINVATIPSSCALFNRRTPIPFPRLDSGTSGVAAPLQAVG
jgi:hypothetical protein